ncbi:hypothetical protein LIER_38226 [Lithospermum erythrorhizon]|uniref:Transposase-associated domain-containing protein n=1 Tax=Lithospermum erythrorhizon TaxID=34254 RepID=A0AAV3Q1Q6_LITER
MAGSHHRWMYVRCNSDGSYNEKYYKGVKKFLTRARKHAQSIGVEGIKCPCGNCQNIYVMDWVQVEIHLCENGFVLGYEQWIYQGEDYIWVSVRVMPICRGCD